MENILNSSNISNGSSTPHSNRIPSSIKHSTATKVKATYNTKTNSYSFVPHMTTEHFLHHFSGQAELYVDERFVYRGGVENGKFQGHGTYLNKYGDLFICNFKNGIADDDNGKIYIRTGDIYVGQIKNNQPEGKGTFYYGDTKKKAYHGYLHNGLSEGKGKYYNEQGVFKGQHKNNERISGTYRLHSNRNRRPIYDLKTNEDGSKVVSFYLNRQPSTISKADLILKIDKNNELHWPDNINNYTKNSANRLITSFDRHEMNNYDSILANLSLIKKNKNIVQFNNISDFGKIVSVKEQLENFSKFANLLKNKGKIITSVINGKQHAVGIIHKDGKTIAVDTSGGIYDDPEALRALQSKGINILTQNMQNTGNCNLMAKHLTNELAQGINDKITMEDLIEYARIQNAQDVRKKADELKNKRKAKTQNTQDIRKRVNELKNKRKVKTQNTQDVCKKADELKNKQNALLAINDRLQKYYVRHRYNLYLKDNYKTKVKNIESVLRELNGRTIIYRQ